MKELTISAKLENMEAVTEFVDEQLEMLDCPMKEGIQIHIAVDELFSNIARYAYDPGSGTATIRMEVMQEPPCVCITFIDSGIPYDPLQRSDPDLTLPLEEREAGGLGIFMVKKIMDEVRYEYRNGQNILSIKKLLEYTQ